MSFTKRLFVPFLPLAFLLPVAPALATTLSWSSYSAWNSNVAGSTELDFTKINYAGQNNYSTAAGKTLTPANNTNLPFLVTGPYGSSYQLTGALFGAGNAVSLLGPSAGRGDITINMPTGGENAFLLGLGSTGSATSLTVALSDGESFNVSSTANTYEFLGLSISHEISWLTISTSTQADLNDFYFATSNLPQDSGGNPVTPEGKTAALIGGGLVTFAGSRRKLFKNR